MLPVRIGEVDGWGLLDTGAQKILSPGFARAAGLANTPAGGRTTINGVEEKSTSLVVHVLPDATVGTWRNHEVRINVTALPLFDRLGGMEAPVAVIGMDWIGKHPFAIDDGAQQVWQQTPEPDESQQRRKEWCDRLWQSIIASFAELNFFKKGREEA